MVVTAAPGQTLTPARGCDCRVCPFFVGNPTAPEPICSGCNTDCSYCGCARSEDRHPTSACGLCPIRCGSRVDIAAWMADVGGTLSFDDLPGGPSLVPGLPRFIPQVDAHEVAAFDASLRWPAYAVGLRRVFSPQTQRIYPRFADRDAHDVLGLAPGQLAMLVGYGEDPLVEGYWTRRRIDRLAEQLAAQHWDVVLSPNYSMYGNQPRAEHLLNFRRNLLVASELCAAGVMAVPNLYWFRKEDLDRYLHWCQDAAPAAVAVNLQTFRTSFDWETMALPGLSYLAVGLPADTAVFVTGSSRADRITALGELFGRRLHLVSQNPLQYARHGALMTCEGRQDRHARVEDLFAANVRHYAGLVEDSTR